jgi:hypothetical protein
MTSSSTRDIASDACRTSSAETALSPVEGPARRERPASILSRRGACVILGVGWLTSRRRLSTSKPSVAR